MTEKIIPQDQLEKSEPRESSRLRNQPRKNYKTFIPQSKILKKVEFQKRFTPASDLKIGTFVLIPNFNTQKGISKKLQPLRKGPYQIIAKPTDVTYKITDSDKKEIVQHRNNLLPYYPKEYALRELTQLYSFTGLKVIQNDPHTDNITKEQNDIHLGNQNTKSNTTKNNTKNLDQNTSQKERKNRKNQPRKNYKVFIPQSKILKKVEFQKQP